MQIIWGDLFSAPRLRILASAFLLVTSAFAKSYELTAKS